MRRPPVLCLLPLCAILAGSPQAAPEPLAGAGSVRFLHPGETQRFSLALAKGQFVSVGIAARAPGFNAIWIGPGGALRHMRFSASAQEPQPFSLVAPSDGTYLLETGLSPDATAAEYVLNLHQPPRDASASDKKRFDAELATVRADELRAKPEQWKDAVREYESALAIWRELDDNRQLRAALGAIGQLYVRSGENRRAITTLNEALVLQRAASDRRGEAGALYALGQVHGALGENQQAIDFFRQALPLRRQAGERFEEALTLHNMAVRYSAIGENSEARENYSEALRLRQELKDNLGVAFTLSGLAIVDYSEGEYQRAFEEYQKLLPLWRDLKSRPGEANTLNNIGLLYAALGEPEKALDSYRQALAVWRELNVPLGQGQALNNIGMADAALGRLAQAQRQYQEALALLQQAGDRQAQAYVLQNLGDAYARADRHDLARQHFQQSLDLKRSLGDFYGQGYSLQALGESYRRTGRLNEAKDHLEQALALRRRCHDRSGEAVTLASLARVLDGLGQSPEARGLIERALLQIEAGRSELASPDLRASYLATQRGSYEFAIGLMMRLGNPGEALRLSERARARSLLEALTEARAGIRQGADPELLRQERELTSRIRWETARLASLRGNDAVAPDPKIESLLTDLAATQNRIRAASPRYAALTQPEPLTPEEIQRDVLDPNTALLEYSLGEERSYGWLVTTRSVHAFALPKQSILEPLARQAYAALQARAEAPAGETASARAARLEAADTAFQTTSSRLSALLLGPLAGRLAAKRLLIVCGGALQYLPFAALPEPGGSEPLVVRHELVSIPSASVLAGLRRERGGKSTSRLSLAIFADPVYSASDPRVAASAPENAPAEFRRLLFSAREASELGALAPAGDSLQATGFAASKAAVIRGGLSRYRLIHFATHAVVDNQHPDLSGIVLSLVDANGKKEDGFVRLYEVYNLHLEADLVVLSACRTALGKEVTGEGLTGLTRGFFYAGAARVAASLWSVQDQATAAFMQRFYFGMLRQKLRPAAAFRQAQLGLRSEARWRSPYYWAAFTLQGEWN